MEGMIEITGVNLVEFAKEVYALSVPRGMGFLHATTDPLSDEDANTYIEAYKDDSRCALYMDYAHGRGCKMDVFRKGDKLFIRYPWYDHTDDDLRKLLQKFNISMPSEKEHGISCACDDCNKKRQPAN